MIKLKKRYVRNNRLQGIVKWFSCEQGYGFITDSDDVDHRFGVQNVRGVQLPKVGDSVTFESVVNDSNYLAVNIVLDQRQNNKEHVGKVVENFVDCHNCSKSIVPKVIVVNGAIDRTVCPFCGDIIKNFSLTRGAIHFIIHKMLTPLFNFIGNYPLQMLFFIVIASLFIKILW